MGEEKLQTYKTICFVVVKVLYKIKTMKKQLLVTIICIVFIMSGCMNSRGDSYTLDASEFGVYEDDSLLFSPEQLDGVIFSFATYESNDRITTKRGLQVGNSIADFCALYGESGIELLIPEHSVDETVLMADYMKDYDHYKGMDININSYFYKDEMHSVSEYLQFIKQNPNIKDLDYSISQYSLGIFFNRQEQGKEDSIYEITISYYSDIRPYVDGISSGSSNDMQGVSEKGILERINSYGISEGDIEYLYDDSDAFLRNRKVYGDDIYRYYFNEDNNLEVIWMKEELSNQYDGQALHNSGYYEEIARSYTEKCLPFFNQDSTEYDVSFIIDRADVSIYDRREGCLVNHGSVMLSGDGTLIQIVGTNNTMEMFERETAFNENDAREIVFEDLKGLGFDSMDDIVFSDIEKQKNGDQIVWYIHAVIPATGFEYSYFINADTGEITETATVLGD